MSQAPDLTLMDRMILRVPLVFLAPFHLGSGQAGFLTDALIQRQTDGKPYIPASSLTGLLRSAADELAYFVSGLPSCQTTGCGSCPVCKLFGFAGQTGSSGGAASRLSLEDAYLLSPTGVQDFEFRQHVGINRRRATAQEKLQYNHEVAPGGLNYGFEILVEKPTADDMRLLLAIFDFWKKKGVSVGGRTTTGLGECQVGEIEFRGLDFSNREHLKNYLLAPGGGQGSTSVAAGEIVPEADLRAWCQKDASEKTVITIGKDASLPESVIIDLAVAGKEPLLVLAGKSAATAEEKGSDAEFIRTSMLHSGVLKQDLVLPGSGLKGILRSRIEKIVRTLNYYQGWTNAELAHQDPSSAEVKYNDHICACAITHGEDAVPRLAACFGNPQEQKRAEKRTGEVYAASCPVCRIFGNSMMRGHLSVGEGRLKPEEVVGKKLFDNVAIDRFAGGAANERKFDTRPLMPAQANEPVFVFRLHLQSPEPWMLALLALVFKDLHSGDIRIGHGTHRGFGRVRGWIVDSEALCIPGSELSSLLKAAFGEGLRIDPFNQYQLPFKEIFGQQEWQEGKPPAIGAMHNFLIKCDEQLRNNMKVWSNPEIKFGRVPGQKSKEA